MLNVKKKKLKINFYLVRRVVNSWQRLVSIRVRDKFYKFYSCMQNETNLLFELQKERHCIDKIKIKSLQKRFSFEKVLWIYAHKM